MSVIVHVYLRLHRQQQKGKEPRLLEQKRGEADQLPCDVYQHEQRHWRERAYTSAATSAGSMLIGGRWAYRAGKSSIHHGDRRKGKQGSKFTSNPGLPNQWNAYAFVTCPILSVMFKFKCRASSSRLQQRQLGHATEAN